MREDIYTKAQQWMGEHFPDVEYVLHPFSERASVIETFGGKVLEGARMWKWKLTALRGWVMWEGPKS